MEPIIRIPDSVLRLEYAQVRVRSHCENPIEFNALCKKWLEENHNDPTPENWVIAAKKVSIPCRRCVQTGRFITGSVNGQPTGPGGICYRCEGKSWQDDEDARRNYGADIHQRVY